MVSNAAKATLHQLAKEIASKKKEHLYVVDAQTGRVVAYFSGKKHSVKKSKRITKLLRLNGQQYVVLHNHPGGKPPSIKDVINMMRSAYAESWLVTPRKKVWKFWGLTGKRLEPKDVRGLRRYKDVAIGIVGRRKKPSSRGAANRLMMQLMKKGVALPPVLDYKVVRANPAVGERRVYETFADLANMTGDEIRRPGRIGVIIISRSTKNKVKQDSKHLLIVYRPDDGGRFYIKVRNYDTEFYRDFDIRHLDDAVAIYLKYRQKLWPEQGYTAKRLKEISESERNILPNPADMLRSRRGTHVANACVSCSPAKSR